MFILLELLNANELHSHILFFGTFVFSQLELGKPSESVCPAVGTGKTISRPTPEPKVCRNEIGDGCASRKVKCCNGLVCRRKKNFNTGKYSKKCVKPCRAMGKPCNDNKEDQRCCGDKLTCRTIPAANTNIGKSVRRCMPK